MTTDFVINAEARSDLGKGASRRLRRVNMVPGIIYGGGKDPQPLSINHDDLIKSLENEAFYSHVLTINIGKEKAKAVLKDLQRHPHKPKIHHVDLLRVSESEKLHMHVPLHFIGDEEAPGVKAGGLFTHQLVEVEVACLPKNLPEFIEVDVSGLGLEDIVHLRDLKLPKGVELVALSHGPEHDLPVASIHRQRGTTAEAAEEEAPIEE